MSTRGRRALRGGAAALLAVAAALTAAGPAQALGNNRVVNRSCGSNYVQSGYTSYHSTYWAETLKNGGTCAGRLSAGLQRTDGYRTARVYGTSNSAYISKTRSALGGAAAYGLHWGCDNCSVTTS